MKRSRMSLPLDGIRVIDLGQIFAAPYCTLQLAFLGADIIKIEPLGGEALRRPKASPGGVNYSFLMLNANKRSVTLNLKRPRGREILLALLADADVLIENYSNGVMASLGLGYADLRPRFPRLIYASGKGYGPDGPWAKLGAMDSTIQAACGFISVTGAAESTGTRTPATFIDMSTGSHLVSAILAALIQRGKTGEGQKVEVAMLDMCIPAMTGLIANELEGKPYQRMGNRHRASCPSNVYSCVDGAILIFCLSEAHWRTIARLMGREELIGTPRFLDHAARFAIADEVDALVSTWTRTLARADVLAILLEKGVPCAPVRSVSEVVADDELTRRRMLIGSEFPTRGEIRVMGKPIKMSAAPDTEIKMRRPPAAGEHTAEVLASIGIDDVALERLRSDGVV
ncbi:MAG: CaiB/BaiF CoA transferase family protein [Candidatus Binataceae bacterium]